MTDLAAEGFGFKTIATAEIDKFCRSVLKARYPSANHFDSVESVNEPFLRLELGKIERPLLISGGFPCQDVSDAGFKAGLNGERSGLWSEFARIIREFKPEYVLIENVAALRNRGLTSIMGDLSLMGYDARWDCIPAASVGAPHMRDRMYITATPSLSYREVEHDGRVIAAAMNGKIIDLALDKVDSLPRAGRMIDGVLYADVPLATVSETRKRAKGRLPHTTSGLLPTPTRADGSGGPGTTPKREGGKNLRTVIAELEGNGRMNPEYAEWMMGVPFGWTDPDMPNVELGDHVGWSEPAIPRTLDHRIKHRGARIRAIGNGLVPQAAAVALGWML
jgi:DNA (cytosine-5)-methyltransferase 1